MITRVKRFGKICLKCHQDYWPGSSACSSHRPYPGLLQKVSLVFIKPEDLKEECKIEKSVLTHDIAIWPLENSHHSSYFVFFLQHVSRITFVFYFAIFCKGATTAGHIKERRSTACEKAGSGLPITPREPKEWYRCYFPSAAPIERG